jgi:hypothetical protein
MPDSQEMTQLIEVSTQLIAAPRQPIIAIAATRIAGGGGPDRDPIALDDDDEQPIPLEDILFAFTSGGVSGVSPLIITLRWNDVSFAQATVYIRTRDALYRVGYESLKSFKKLLPAYFEQVSKSVIANLASPRVMALKGSANHVHTLTYAVEKNDISWGLEQVRIGREFLVPVRARYGYRRAVSVRTTKSGASPSV